MKIIWNYKSLPKKVIKDLPIDPIVWDNKGLDAGDYGMYDASCWGYSTAGLFLSARKLTTPITIDWVTQEQIKAGMTPRPFTHRTSGLESRETYKPPFHIQVKCPLPHTDKYLPCPIWLMIYPKDNPTIPWPLICEHDLVETGGSYFGNTWFANHWGTDYGKDHYKEQSNIAFPLKGTNQFDLFIYSDHSEKYLNGHLVQTWVHPMDYNYRLHSTLIVKTPKAENIIWHIDKVAIENL